MAIKETQLFGAKSFGEKRRCLGPTAEGVVGGGALSDVLGTAWQFTMDNSGTIESLKSPGGGPWVAEPLGLSVPPISEFIDPQFNLGGRVILCWQVGASVFVRQYDTFLGNYVIRGPFPGTSPQLVNDAFMLGTAAATDIHMIYMNGSDIVYRREADNYANEILLESLSPSMTYKILDVYHYPSFYSIAVMDSNEVITFYNSDTYPQEAEDSGAGNFLWQNGAYVEVLIDRLVTDKGAGNFIWLDGAYIEVLIERLVGDEKGSGDFAWLDGSYIEILIERLVGDEKGLGDFAWQDGTYDLTLFLQATTEKGLGDFAWQDGQYIFIGP